MNKFIRRLSLPIAIFAISWGVISSNTIKKDFLQTKATPVLLNSFDFIDGGSSNNNNYASTNISTDVKYAADNPGGTSGTTSWEADYANLSLTTGTRLGGKAISAVQTDDTTAWANIKTKFTFAVPLEKVEIIGVSTFDTAGNVTKLYLQNSTTGTTWTTVADTSSKTGNIVFEGLSIQSGSYLRFGIDLTASSTNSGIVFTGIKVYESVSGSFGSLSHIELNTSNAQLQFPVSSTFNASGLVVTAFDDSDPSISKVINTFTTDYDDHVFSLSDLGTRTVTVTYTEGVTKTATYDIVVIDLVEFTKITNLSELHFGATYIIVNEADNKILGIDDSNTYRVSNNVTINSNAIIDSSTIQKFKLVISPELGSYGFELINGDAAGNYLNYTGTGNTLTTTSDITIGASWNLSFTDGDVSIVLSTNTSRKIGYNVSSPRFAAYTSAQSPIQLYLDTTSVDASISASLVASEINIGSGNTAFNKCESVLEFLTNAIDRLSLDSKSIFNTSSESAFVSARARIAYLQAWVLANPSGGSVRLTSPVDSSSTLMATFIISAIGITSLLGYYFVNKRRKIN